MINRKISPDIVHIASLDLTLKPYQHFTLDNGVEVYAFNGGSQEVVQAEWVFYAGNNYETQKTIAAATSHLIKNGTIRHSAFELNEKFEYYGAYLNRACYNETAVISLSCLNKHLHTLLPVVRELITEAIFPQEELDIYIQNSKQRLLVNLKKCDFVANRIIDAKLYGENHPYGTYNNAEDYDAVTRDQLKAFYANYYTQGKTILFISGLLPVDLEAQLNQHFGDLPLNTTVIEAVAPVAVPSNDKKQLLINDAEGVQGAIRIARHFPNRKDPDFLKAQVLNCIFGGFFGSRLMSNIREDKGYTYGIYSYIQNHVDTTAWLVSTEAGRKVCEATVKEIYEEMRILREEPVSEEELLLVRNYMMGSILGDLDGPFHVMSKWKSIILNDLDKNYFKHSIQTIQSVTASELQELAVKYLQEEDFYELVVV